MKIKTVMTTYKIGKGSRHIRFTVAADLHNSSYEDIIPLIAQAHPDIILIPGDLCGLLCEAVPGDESTERYVWESKRNHIGLAFVSEISKLAPVYYSVGNHEVRVSSESRELIEKAGAVLLDNEYVSIGDFWLGGLSSGGAYGLLHKSSPPDLEWLDSFAALDGKKILMSHHPEYWKRHIIKKGIFLTVSGHAHGGQWRIFGQGIFAPGQGFLPRYTSGVHRRRGEYLAVSRGLRKHTKIPRINNQPELITIDVMYD